MRISHYTEIKPDWAWYHMLPANSAEKQGSLTDKLSFFLLVDQKQVPRPFEAWINNHNPRNDYSKTC